MNPPLADAAARKAALDPEQSCIVQAPAGSGKTELLVRRYLVLLARVNTPEEILAITFTRKATAEMKSRILEALTSVAGCEDRAELSDELSELALAAVRRNRKLGWNLLDNPARLKIQTIDALCADLVRSMPWSSRFGAAPKILDDDQANELYLEAARKTLNHIDSSGPVASDCHTVLALVHARFDRAQALVAQMLVKRDLWLRGINLSEREQFEGMWLQVVEKSISLANHSVPAELKQKLLPLLRYAAYNVADTDPDHILAGLRDIEAFPGGESGMLEQWRAIAHLLLTWRQGDYHFRKGINKNQGFPVDDGEQKAQKKVMLEVIGELSEHPGLEDALSIIPLLPDCRFTNQQWNAMEALFKILKIAVAELKILFSQGNCADFAEITQRAELALGGNEAPTDLALSMDYRISHLLMDEVQDTSRAQLELVTRLTRGWDPGDGRTLFFVGDPMQSIYRFREADVSNFLEIQKHGVGNIIPQSLVLESNFRSSSVLVDWFNRVFAEVFPELDDINNGAVSYSPGTAAKTEATETSVTLGSWVDDEEDCFAATISRQAGQLLEKDPEITIGILGRSRRHLVPVAQALRKSGISFQAIDLESMQNRPAIQDLMALTRAIIQPGDRIAWLSILRAPWCGLDIRDLALLAESNHDANIIELACDPAVTSCLSDTGQRRLARLVSSIEQPLGYSGRRPLRECVLSAWLNLGAACFIEPQDVENCEAYFQLIDTLDHEFEQITPLTLSTAVGRLWSADSTPAQVQLLTIHKSKGLQFDAVFLAALDRRPRNQDQALLQWARSGQQLLVAALPQADDNHDEYNTYLKKLERLRQHHENRRLLYVACTRAKRHLYLYANLRTNNQGEIASPVSGSLLSLLWPVLEPEFLENSTKGTDTHYEQSIIPLKSRRVPSNWDMPGFQASVGPVSELSTINKTNGEPIEFSWTGEILRVSGIAIHKMLQDIETGKWNQWKNIDKHKLVRSYQHVLVANGLTGQPLKLGSENIMQAIDNIRVDPRAGWIFADEHSNVRTEWPLTGLLDGAAVNVIIDRCFTDSSGIRWIIDFKSSRHEQPDKEDFLAQEKQRYLEQMSKYAKIANLLESRETRLALYYPLLSEWVEWAA